MPVDELVDLDSILELDDLTFPADLDDWTTAVEPQELRRFDDLPPIAEPGLAPFTPVDGGHVEDDDDWPSAA